MVLQHVKLHLRNIKNPLGYLDSLTPFEVSHCFFAFSAAPTISGGGRPASEAARRSMRTFAAGVTTQEGSVQDLGGGKKWWKNGGMKWDYGGIMVENIGTWLFDEMGIIMASWHPRKCLGIRCNKIDFFCHCHLQESSQRLKASQTQWQGAVLDNWWSVISWLHGILNIFENVW